MSLQVSKKKKIYCFFSKIHSLNILFHSSIDYEENDISIFHELSSVILNFHFSQDTGL